MSRRVPRASIGVSVLRDSDYHGLVATKAGRAAWGCYVALIASAKDKRNLGVFREPLPVVAEAIHWPLRDLTETVKLITEACRANGNQPWLVQDERGLVIRKYLEWNEHANWGGTRSVLECKLTATCNHFGAPPQVGNGVGIPESSGRGIGGNPEPITSGDRWEFQPLVAAAWAHVPLVERSGPDGFVRAFIEAVRDRGANPGHIAQQIAAYYSTPRGKGGYRWSAINFLKDGHYNDAPESWGEDRLRAKQRQNQRERLTAPAPDKRTGAAERIRSERLALEYQRAVESDT